MSKAHLGGFVAIAILATAGVDYVNQARQAGSPAGGLTAAGYAASITDRIAGREPHREVAAPAPAPAPAKKSGGVLAMITGLFGGGRSGAAKATPTAVAVTRIGANGDCALAGGVKRCSIGGN